MVAVPRLYVKFFLGGNYWMFESYFILVIINTQTGKSFIQNITLHNFLIFKLILLVHNLFPVNIALFLDNFKNWVIKFET